MTDNKFEPGQLVLVRDADNDIWQLAHYDYLRESGMHGVIGGFGWNQCIPLNEETKHLHRTSQPYGPPKPPVEYKFGDKIEVWRHAFWCKGIFVKNDCCTSQPIIVAIQGHDDTCHVTESQIRPLPDTADTVKCGICGKTINEDTATNDVECGPCCPEHYKDDTAAH